MKFLKFAFFTYIFLNILSPKCYAQNSLPKGIELCDEVYNFYSSLDLDVEKQQIVTSPGNIFPYNVIIPLVNQQDSDNLIFCVKMENAWDKKDLIFDIISDLKYRNFNSTVVFIYNGSVRLPRRLSTGGEQAFISSLNTSKKNTAFIINLDSDENSIQSGSMGRNSPSWLVNATFDAYLKEKLSDDLPVYYLSQISKMGFNTEILFSSFAFNQIPAISAGFNTETTDNNTIYKVVSNFFDSYNLEKDSAPDYHSLMFRFGTKKFDLTEYTIVKIWIGITLLSLIFIYILAFINKSLRNSAWEEIKNYWYTIPTIYLLTVSAFYLARVIYRSATHNANDAITAFGLPVLQIIFASFLVFTFFMLEIILHKKNYGERSVDYLIVITTFINQFIFCLTDISLFPLFMILCILSILSLLLHRNWFHILLFIIMIAAYMPYIFQLYGSTSTSSLRLFFLRGKTIIFGFAFIMLPIFLMWFRILTAIRKRITKNQIFLVINLSNFVVLMCFSILLNSLVFYDDTYKLTQNTVIDAPSSYSIIEASYSDKKVFDETLRTININLKEPSIYTSVRVRGEEKNPVLYSQYDYTQMSSVSSFQIPSYPPSQMSFTYGASNIKSTIEIESITKSDVENEYISYKTIIETGAE